MRDAIAPYAAKLAVWRGYEGDLETLGIAAGGIALYTALVFAFYQNISRVEAFHSREKAGWWGRVVHYAESALVFPLMSMLYFAVLAGSLFVLAKPTQATYNVLLLAMAVVLSVRLTAFMSENMSADLAKLLPLGLLGVLLVDPGSYTLAPIWGRLKEVPSFGPVLGRFFLLFLVSEMVMRTARVSWRSGVKAWKNRQSRRVPVVEASPAPAPVVEAKVADDAPFEVVTDASPEAPLKG